jgi:polysaccharide biosynthesis/export protein
MQQPVHSPEHSFRMSFATPVSLRISASILALVMLVSWRVQHTTAQQSAADPAEKPNVPRSLSQPASSYLIGPQDVLFVAVFGQPDLTGKFSVESDGTLSFPLVGRLKAAGLTLRAFETELKKQLADGFLTNPQVSVGVEQYISQKIFVMGEVRQPGAYPLAGSMALIEALARAGASTTSDVIIVRPREAKGPTLPGEDQSAEVTRVNLKQLQSGQLSENVDLRDGDTIFVPRPESVYVFGQVRNPGAYGIQKDTTVLQALSLAGGVTENGAINRVKIVRAVNGKTVELKVKLNDVVLSGDTVIVPERYF